MRRRYITMIIAVTVLCALLSLTGCAASYTADRDYQTGLELLAYENYREAAAMFEKLGSYEDASILLMYCRAVLAAENGEYAAAREAFATLDGFRDTKEMRDYYEGRETETKGREALETGDFDAAAELLMSAAGRYEALSDFRDASRRAAGCLDTLYDQGCTLLRDSDYAEASDLFAVLDSYKDSSEMQEYCEACRLEETGAHLEAAARFEQIPTILDAAARAEAAREAVYQQALALAGSGGEEAALSLFADLGSYRDAEEQRSSLVRELVYDRLKSRDYEGALFAMDAAPDAVPLQQADEAEVQRVEAFLDGFVSAYLHFSSGSIDSYSGYSEVLPYIERNGALDKRFRQVLMIGSYSHSSNFIYYGSTLLDLFRVEENYYLAYLRATASVSQPVGPVEVARTFRILVHDTESGLIAGSIDDCLYNEPNPSGRPVVTGPLPGGELPPDEDGDGIIIVDVKKKGFNGTMIIVLDPSRVFAGGPGFYGGNGMLLEDLVRRYDALGGINGGGFIDEDGGGSGGFPEGLTIVDGQTYLWADSGASAAFDENNILHVGYFTKESAAAAGIRDCVSFGPALVVDGVGEYGSHMESGINPRTAIGQRADGAVLMLCVDGRQLHSIGASFGDIRDVMLDFCAVNACSLDGGSSTVMYYNGAYLNSPSSASGTSRYLPNAFLIRK